jgi:aldehyde:ferredoxin oxidoreductase
VAWFAKHGLVVNRSTLCRWVQRFLPLFQHAARAHRTPVGTAWRTANVMTSSGTPWWAKALVERAVKGRRQALQGQRWPPRRVCPSLRIASRPHRMHAMTSPCNRG